MNVRFSGMLLFFAAILSPQSPAQTAGSKASNVLSQQRMDDLVPQSVFFASKVATTQLRNSGGVATDEDKVTEFMLVDASGYSSGIRERYQFYLLTSVPVEIAGKRLEPGAYGGGFVSGHVLLMDLGARDIFQAPLQSDAEMKRPRPLSVSTVGNEHRLYLGRDFVVFRQLSQ